MLPNGQQPDQFNPRAIDYALGDQIESLGKDLLSTMW